jgi:inner membrane transporter RhtA
LLLLTMVCAQVGAAIATHLFSSLGPTGTVFLRLAFGAAMLMVVERPRFDQTLRLHWRRVLVFGLAIAGMNLAFYEAIARIPLGIAVTIEFMGPMGVAIVTSRRWLDFVWIGLATLGIILLTPLTGTALDPLGIIFALIAGMGWATYVLLSAPIGHLFPRGTGLALSMGLAAIALFPFGLFSAGSALLNPGLLGLGLIVALLSSAIPFSLEFAALKRLPPRVYGVLVGLEPAIAAIVGVLLLGEILEWRTVAAIVCVTVATIGVTFSKPPAPGNS